ncbi:histidine kinase [Arcobacter sp. CECT 8985]|nr:histidine kinase [Arcobacter sp. CECT 8985]
MSCKNKFNNLYFLAQIRTSNINYIKILEISNFETNKILIDRLEDSNKLLQKSKGKLKNLNENLQVQVSKEVEQRVKKQEEVIRANELLSQQSKLASMGEMIMNIAHQWRQPLTVVSSNLVLLELLDEKNKLTKDKLITKIHESQNQIDFMSKTIDDFRNFFKPNKNKEKFYISSAIETTLSLVKVTYKKNQIEIIKNIDENIEIINYKNEFSQVILNLLNNCNDAFISNEIANPKINISVFKKNNQVVITISDNAGGIKIEPIEKIFEPYISTKHQSLGTGIGLYMCKTIIEKNMKGFLSVKNISNGAIFEIILNEE